MRFLVMAFLLCLIAARVVAEPQADDPAEAEGRLAQLEARLVQLEKENKALREFIKSKGLNPDQIISQSIDGPSNDQDPQVKNDTSDQRERPVTSNEILRLIPSDMLPADYENWRMGIVNQRCNEWLDKNILGKTYSELVFFERAAIMSPGRMEGIPDANLGN